MQFSYGQHAKDSHPQPFSASWEQFVAWLKTYYDARQPGSKDGTYVCAASFDDNHRHLKKGNPRSWAIPLDVDQPPGATADVIRTTLHGYRFVAHTTHNHTAAVPRWRVFVALANSVDAATHEATHRTLSALFQGLAAVNSCDATRVNYMPDRCKHPALAEFISGDGQFYPPTQAQVTPPAVTEHSGDGPVPGWCGPTDDVELLTVACNARVSTDEQLRNYSKMGRYWIADPEWLTQHHPPTADDFNKGRAWNWTTADAGLANEAIYWTGGDIERAARIMRMSALGQLRGDDEDWANRKVHAALTVGLKGRKPDQYHFMSGPKTTPKTPAAAHADPNLTPTDNELREACAEATATLVPGGTQTLTAEQAAIANIPVGQSVSMNDFFAFLPDHTYIHRASGERFSAASVDELVTKEVRSVLALTVPVHKYTWAPGKGERFVLSELDDTYVDGEKVWLYNSYRAPKPHVHAGDASRWLELVRRLYPDDVEHLISYFADAVQNPGRKCNHAVVLGSGTHGIGKDTLLAPVAYAVGRNNFRSIKPTALASEFNPWVTSVMVQISESHDLGEGQRGLSRFEFYERCKDLAAAPPASIDCRPLYQNPFPVANVLRLVLTTNHQVDGLHIDPKDRRHYCAWSDAPAMTETESKAIWDWYDKEGGTAHVAHFLATLDLPARGWSHSAPPLRTAWWHQLVSGAASAEEDRFSDALDKLGRPDWVTAQMIEGTGDADLTNWIRHPSNRRKLEREMVKSGYQRLPNPHEAKRGRWLINGGQLVVYRRSDVPAATLLRQAGAIP